MTQDIHAALRNIPLFASLDDESLRQISTLASEFEAKQGHVLIERGQAGSGVFIIERGSVRIDLPDGRQVERREGQFFGELAVLTDAPRTARVAAATDVRCLAIGRRDMLDLLQENSDVAIAMLHHVAARLVEATTG